MVMKRCAASRGNSRRCVACGKVGHNVGTCKSPAASVILSLREKLKLRRVGQLFKPKRVAHTRAASKKASKKYTPNPGKVRRKTARRVPVSALKGKGLIAALGADDQVSLKSLQTCGMAPCYRKRPFCKGLMTGAPASRKLKVKKSKLKTKKSKLKIRATNTLWHRCSRYSCR